MTSLYSAPLVETDDPLALVAGLSVTRLDTIFSPDPRLEAGPGLPARLRGAWGQRLRRDAETDEEAAQALALFFPDKTAPAGFAGAAPPYRLAAEVGPEGLAITLALIGFAGRWRRAAFDALIGALSEPPGLALADRKSPWVTFHLMKADWTRTEGVPLPPLDPPRVTLDFVTPLRIGPGDALGTRFADVIVSLAERGRELSPWTGLGFRADLGLWRERAKAMRFVSRGLRPVVWDSFSSQNGHDAAAGYLGPLTVEFPGPEAMALIVAGTVLHAGRGVAKGCGRYRLVLG